MKKHHRAELCLTQLVRFDFETPIRDVFLQQKCVCVFVSLFVCFREKATQVIRVVQLVRGVGFWGSLITTRCNCEY